MAGIRTPDRVSPSPKRKTRRGSTPPAKRTTFAVPAEEKPFRPNPLTPIGWDVEAAKASGAQHPSASQATAPGAGDNNAVLKNAISKWQPQNKWRLMSPAAKAKAKAKSKAKGVKKGGGKGKSTVKLPSGVEVDQRVVTISPGKGQRRGRGKSK